MKHKFSSLLDYCGAHLLRITSSFLLVLWVILYIYSDPSTHWGSFFGNAIADWSGVVVMVFATIHLYERGSEQSRTPPSNPLPPVRAFLRDHSLTIFLAVTGAFWIWLFVRMNPDAKWGQVVGNIVSEWTQTLGMVVLTKHMIRHHFPRREDASSPAVAQPSKP